MACTFGAAALVLLVHLLAPEEGAAHAGYNEVSIVRVCGASACLDLDPPLELFHIGGLKGPKAVSAEPALPGPYYELQPQFTRPPPAFFVPASGSLRSFPDAFGLGDPVWLRLEPRIEAALRAALAGLEPFPPPALRLARVDGHEVGDPQAYLALYDELPAVPPDEGPFPGGRTITLVGERLTPWSDGYNVLSYAPAGGFSSGTARSSGRRRPSSA